ncbi:hypothetical protein FIBSPDRAFT_948353, partial [Athelia psychrophila]
MPPFALHPRGQCMKCGKACVAWVGAPSAGSTAFGPRNIPNAATEACLACGHGWIGHFGSEVPPPSSSAFHFLKGVCGTDCGGYWSPRAVWDTSGICPCAMSWASHMPFSHASPTVPPSAAPRPSAPGNPIGYLAPPITAFGGQRGHRSPSPSSDENVRLTASQIANKNRNSSAKRVRERGARENTISKRAKKSAPPRPFPGGGPSAAERSTAGSTYATVHVLCLPRTMSAADERNHDIPTKGMQRLHRTAEQHNLWFTVAMLLTDESILFDLHTGIKDHFASSQLTLPEGEDPEDLTDFTTLPWQLLKM